MRWLWVTLVVSACAPLSKPLVTEAGHRHDAIITHSSDNCGTPDEYKRCDLVIRKPPPLIPVYSEPLGDPRASADQPSEAETK